MQDKAWLQVRTLILPVCVIAMLPCDRVAEQADTLSVSHKATSGMRQHLLCSLMAQSTRKPKGSINSALSLQLKELGGVDHTGSLPGYPQLPDHYTLISFLPQYPMRLHHPPFTDRHTESQSGDLLRHSCWKNILSTISTASGAEGWSGEARGQGIDGRLAQNHTCACNHGSSLDLGKGRRALVVHGTMTLNFPPVTGV